MKALEGESQLPDDTPPPEETGPSGPVGNRAHGHRISCYRMEISRFLMYNPDVAREIVAQKKAIVALCLDLGVERLLLFGSAIRERTVVDVGDLDFVVPFKPMPPVEYIRNCFRVAEQLQALLQAPVDLVELDSIKHPYFKEEADETKVAVYEIA